MTHSPSGPVWGCVADDFTGAGDIASFFVKNSIQTILINGVPDSGSGQCMDSDIAAYVIALKSRTMEKELAVQQTLDSFRWLKRQGCTKLYFKYCSTFDSTPKGNIGPVIDAILDEFNYTSTIVCPGFPVNNRTVRDGVLYVDGVPLAQSSMKDHPLTPMWDSEVAALLRPQGKYPALNITHDLLDDPDAVTARLDVFGKEHPRYYIVVDYVTEEDGARIAQRFGHMEFFTGASSIIAHLARVPAEERENAADDGRNQRRVMFAGSCSQATKMQVEQYIHSGGYAVKMHPDRLSDGRQTKEQLWEKIAEDRGRDILLYSAGITDAIRDGDEEKTQNAQILEETIAHLAHRSVQSGERSLVIAGGETSGAVIQSLGYQSYLIGDSVAPGVPIMIPTQNRRVRLVLKSGNFGDKNFFEIALKEG